jgi:hypothetical protein
VAVNTPTSNTARPGVAVPYNTFVGGFVTEATGLSYPENTCRDIDNCDINISGKVRRRLGLDLEPHGKSLEAKYLPNSESQAVTCWEWTAVGGDPALNFYVLQVGLNLYILNRDSEPLSASNFSTGKAFDDGIRLSGNAAKWGTKLLQWARAPIQGCSGAGRFWFTWPYDDPMYLEYDAKSQSISKQYVGTDERFINGRIAIRDFVGMPFEGDPSQPQYKSSFPNNRAINAYFYNLYNSGWYAVEDIVAYEADSDGGFRYPALNMVWYLGKDSDGSWDADNVRRTAFGNEPAPGGRQFINPLRMVRSFKVSGRKDPNPIYRYFTKTGTVETANDPVVENTLKSWEAPSSGFSCCAFFAGRLWMAGEKNAQRPGGLYFSKVVAKAADAGFCAQVNDPTNEEFPDLLDTDGGVIYLSEASGIVRLVPAGQGLLVFATNGVWFVRGGEAGFTANQYTVDKVSNIGVVSPFGVVQYEEVVHYWASGGVYAVQFQGGFAVNAVSVSDTTIRRYFQAIPAKAKEQVYGFADELGKRLIWMWRDEDEYSDGYQRQSYRNKMLIYDLRLGAFYKYTLSFDEDKNIYPMIGIARTQQMFPSEIEAVTLSTGEAVTLSNGEAVLTEREIDGAGKDLQSNIYIVTMNGIVPGDDKTGTVVFCQFDSLDFVDYAKLGAEKDYSSYIEVAPQTWGDLHRNKAATYVHSFFQKTEYGFELVDVNNLQPKYPSSCLLQGKWDWHITATGGRWTDTQQAYKIRRSYSPTGALDTFDTGEEVVYTKRKLRGKGKSLALRYSSETGKDFQLLGFVLDITGNTS